MLAFVTLLASGFANAADDWPSKPVRFIVPFAAGGGADVTARVISEPLAKLLGQPVIVENKSGAGGNIGTNLVAKAAPDGYTMLFAYEGPISMVQFYSKELPFNPRQDFSAVSRVADAPLVLVVNKDLPVNNVSELIAYSKAHPQKLFYGSSGLGGTTHLVGEIFNQQTGTSFKHVPYKGGAPAMTDLVGGQTQFQFATIPSAIPYIQSGKIRPLAVLSTDRFELLPEVPTLEEAGVSGIEINNWYGIMLPANTPAAIVERLNAALVETLQDPAVRSRFTQVGLVSKSNSPSEFSEFIKRDMTKWETIFKDINIALD